ncbi:MAG: hypothetical protein WCW31_01500, partial [Patescibacteria group bacterium]
MLNHLMRTQEVPARYMLKFDNASASFLLHLHPEFLEFMGNILHSHEARILESLKRECEKLEIPELIWNPSGDMGCGQAMLYQGEKDNWQTWQLPLPRIMDGHTGPQDWSKGFATSMSLRSIFDFAHHQDAPGSKICKQMMSYSMVVANRIYGGA